MATGSSKHYVAYEASVHPSINNAHVVRLDVAVKDAVVVKVLEPLSNVLCPLQLVWPGQQVLPR